VSPEADVLARHRMGRAEAACKEGDLLADQAACRGAVNRYYYAAFHAARALPRSFEKRLSSDYSDFVEISAQEVDRIKVDVHGFVSACRGYLARAV